MTLQRSDGPLVVVGRQASLGSASAAGGPYVSGVSENPDSGPSPIFAGVGLRDMRTRTRPDGIQLVAGGYANQEYCYPGWYGFTVDVALSAPATNNIALAQALTQNTAMTLTAGAGVTLLTADYVVPGTLNVVPAGCLRLDAIPTYRSYGDSGAVQGWNLAAVGRGVSLTVVGTNLSGLNVTVRGYDLYGYPVTQTLAGPNNNTVNTLKGFKWIASVTPSASNAGTMSVGTADIIEFPLRADLWCDVDIWVNNAIITANTGFVAAVTTNPSTAGLGSTRGTYALQTPSNGTIRTQIAQRLRPANIDSVAGVFGITPV